MIEAAVTAFGGGSVITAVLGLIIKMWDKKQEAKERDALMDSRNNKLNIESLNATAHRTNNIWGNLTRVMLAIVPQFIMLALLYIGYNNPDTVIWVSHQEEPTNFTFLFGLFDFSIPREITWRAFNGIVIIPAMFAQMGAVNTYFLIGGFFSRR